MEKLPAERVHLIGIGGTGLSAIARLLLESGCQVSGSDRTLSALAAGLQSAGVTIYVGHRAENTHGAELIIRSSAIPDDNVEVRAAQAAGIPVLKRSEFLGQLMADHLGIAVAGSHGKTTTTAMIAWMLTAVGLDPSYIIGGVSINLGANAHAGKGQAFVIEADEYDRMFLGLQPQIAVVTNIEHDHPDCFPTAEDFYQAFQAFTGRLLPGGVLVACADDPGVARLLADVQQRGITTTTYGMDKAECTYCAQNLRSNPAGGFTFDFVWNSANGPEMLCTSLALQVPGTHNVLNALAALSVAHQMALPMAPAGQALEAFCGTGRRFELRGEAQGVAVIDDYGHHPSEIRATLSAARSRYPGRQLWAVWQPHTYSRTRMLFDAFAGSFDQANHVLVTEVYAAREPVPQDGFSAQQVVLAMRHADAHFVPDLAHATSYLLERLQPQSVLVVLSAGDADQISTDVLAGLQGR
ncbi:MAG: UDP-N-acetylmuramate--L-alanine ligase [Anaerolineales bacterium]|nr:UDP-N-acetylmuramate--L-alanine ligase [Anaerolineales bacterium]